MEEKKFDPYQFIGFILIALILTWMLYRNGTPQEEINNTEVTTEQVVPQNSNYETPSALSDSLAQQQKVTAYGNLGGLFAIENSSIISFETKQMTIELDPKGG